VVNPEWVNPAKQKRQLASFDATRRRLCMAAIFHSRIALTNPVENSHALYGDDSKQMTWGNVTWFCERPIPVSADPDPCTWIPVGDDAAGTIRVRSNDAEFELKLQAPTDAGDGTVPAERSGAKAPVKGCTWKQIGYAHQDVYHVDEALSATLYAMVRMDQKFHS